MPGSSWALRHWMDRDPKLGLGNHWQPVPEAIGSAPRWPTTHHPTPIQAQRRCCHRPTRSSAFAPISMRDAQANPKQHHMHQNRKRQCAAIDDPSNSAPDADKPRQCRPLLDHVPVHTLITSHAPARKTLGEPAIHESARRAGRPSASVAPVHRPAGASLQWRQVNYPPGRAWNFPRSCPSRPVRIALRPNY